jgi:plastocyanin
MRDLNVSVALGIAALAAACLTPAPAPADECPFSGGAAGYAAAPVVRYQTRVTAYAAPPVYYLRSYAYAPPYAPAPAAARPTTAVTVGAYDNHFGPTTITVQPGTTVRWVNYGRHTHTVTAADGRWDSGDLAPGATYSATFQQPGTYAYYCRHHAKDRMQGTIVVGGGGPGPSRASGGPRPSGY